MRMAARARKHIRSVEVEIYPGIGHDLLSENRNRRSHASSTSLKATIQSDPESRGIGRRHGQPTRLRRLTGKVYRPPASQAWDSREPSEGREWLLRQPFSVTTKITRGPTTTGPLPNGHVRCRPSGPDERSRHLRRRGSADDRRHRGRNPRPGATECAVDKANLIAAQCWWRTLSDDLTVERAQQRWMSSVVCGATPGCLPPRTEGRR